MLDIESIIVLAGLALVAYGYHRAYQAIPRDVWERTQDELDRVIEALPDNQERIVRAVVEAALSIIRDSVTIVEIETLPDEDEPDDTPRGQAY
jgi:hypothetical protein